MSQTSSATVRNWGDVDPEPIASGVEGYELLDTGDGLRARVLTVRPGETFRAATFDGEAFYHVLAGSGLLRWDQGLAASPYQLEANTGGWIPGAHEHGIENTGEGPIRCLNVSCETNASYGSGDGNVTRLGSTTPDDIGEGVWHGYDVEEAEGLSLAGYQALAPDEDLGEHSHDEEVSYLIRGEGKLDIEGGRHQLAPGTATHVPSDIPHNLISEGEDQFGYIVIEFVR